MRLLMTLLAAIAVISSSDPVAIYYCGFSGSFCGQSNTDDTNHNTTLVVLAFANILSNGSVVMDTDHYPCSLVAKWQGQGKKVFLSVGGANAQWGSIFSSATNQNNAITSIETILMETGLDGIDLDIQDYAAAPSTVASWIGSLKTSIRGKLLSIAPQCVGVYQGETVPSSGGSAWNYWVPIINQSINSIDLVMVQAYNNWYDGIQGGTLSYLQDVYLNWINAKSPFCLGCQVIPNFKGVPPSKLAIGVLGSTSAGNSGYFATGLVIDSFQEWLSNNTYSVAGFMIWDSHWDSSNGFNISNSVLTSYNSTPLTPPTPAPIVCLI